LTLQLSPYLLLFLSLICFTVSFLVRRQALAQIKSQRLECFKKLFQWLSHEELDEPSSCPTKSIDLLEFYKYCLKQKDLPPLSPLLESRWSFFALEHTNQAKLCDFFYHADTKKQKKILLSFKYIPLWEFQAFCLAWILREKKTSFLSMALDIWALLPYDAPWSFTWLALAFSENWDNKLISQTIHPVLNMHQDSYWIFSEAFSSANVKILEIHQAFQPKLMHHDPVFQDIAIYGLGFFKCSSSLNALIEKLYSTDNQRLSLLLRSIAKLQSSESLKLVFDWAKTINYPDWDLMEEVLVFYSTFHDEGKYWKEQLKNMDHYLWNHFFTNSPSSL
jgi:hypothetical protein